ncbi:hypothetical protein [Methanolobus sp.]|nr:hypothetical protein [Methanolobus sp.]
MHACVSCEGFPLTLQIFSGKDYDNQHFFEDMEDIKIKTPGRPQLP